jgi:hypothetical protein
VEIHLNALEPFHGLCVGNVNGAVVGFFQTFLGKVFAETACPDEGTPYIGRPWIAGWSSLVARQAHNLKAAGSNPAPATNLFGLILNFSLLTVY